VAAHLPAPATVELRHQRKEPVLAGVEVGRQHRDLLLQLLQGLHFGVRGRVGNRGGTRGGSIRDLCDLAHAEGDGDVRSELDHGTTP
jgi:hypothetical protein